MSVLGNYIYDTANDRTTATVGGAEGQEGLTSLPLGVTGGGEVYLKVGTVAAITIAGVTVANGGDTAQGTTTDAPVADNTTVASATTATGIGLWKRLVNLGIAILAKQPALGTAGTASTNVITVQGIASGTALATSDSGAAWTAVFGVSSARFTSADQTAAVASVSDAPTTGQKLVITDIEISVDTAMRVDFTCESSATVIATVYMAANQTVNLCTRSNRKLATADKKLQVRTSAAGNISVGAFYRSEA